MQTRQRKPTAREVAMYQAGASEAVEMFQERIGELELALHNQGWIKAGDDVEQAFSRDALRTIVSFARLMFLKNPLIRRGVTVQADYVFGQGVEFEAAHPRIQEVIDEFLNDEENQQVLSSHQAMICNEWELQLAGNVYFALFVNKSNGFVRVRTIPIEEIDLIVSNPEDRQEIWAYVRKVPTKDTYKQKVIVYPDVLTDLKERDLDWVREQVGQYVEEIRYQDDVRIICVKSDTKAKGSIAPPEVYSSLDWAKAYKKLLEDWATIIAAYAKMAFKISNLKGQKQVGAAKSKLETTVSLTNPTEQNPTLLPGSTFLGAGGVNIESVRTAGATTSAEEGKPLQLMVAAGLGIPNTFFGDANVGNFATAKTLDRPTELKMLSRQEVWASVYSKILQYVISQSAKARNGLLRTGGAKVTRQPDRFTGRLVDTVELPRNTDAIYGPTDMPIPSKVTVKFPSILERNVTDRVRAVVNSATLFGKPLHNIIPDKRLIARWLLEALGEKNINKVLDKMYPEGSDTEIKQPEAMDMLDKQAKLAVAMKPKPAPGGGGSEDPSGNG